MKIEEHISELLFEHDCVIVPDFGGFVCNYAPAQIDPVKHLFEPPGKRILFNKGLTRNDGLLAHHISGKLKVPYDEALASINEEVTLYKQVIQKGKRLTLDNIGLIYVDEKGTMLFQQDNKLNYLTDSFGLAPFYHLPGEAIIEEAAPKKVIPIYNERKKVRLYTSAAVIAALAISAFFFTLMEKQTNMRFSSFNFFSKKAPALYIYSPYRYKDLPGPVFNANDVPHVFVTATPAPKTVAPVANNSAPIIAKAKPDATKTVPEKNNSATTFTPGTFSIIVGSFGVKENAEKLVRELTKQNLPVAIVGKNPSGLYMVGYGNYKNHNDATNERVTFMKKFSKDAWVKGN